MVRVLTSVDSAPQHWEYTERYVSHFRFHVFKEAQGETHRSTDLGKPRPLRDGLSCSLLTQNVSLSYRNSRQLSRNTVISLLHWVRESTVVQEAVDCPTPASQRPTAPFLYLLVSQQSFISPRLPQENRTSSGSKPSPFDLGSNTCWLGDLGHVSLTIVPYRQKWGCWVIAPHEARSMLITTLRLGVDYLSESFLQ